MSVSSKADAMRAQLNLKNLQRHDSSILEIIATASYVTVYRNQGDGWVRLRLCDCSPDRAGAQSMDDINRSKQASKDPCFCSRGKSVKLAPSVSSKGILTGSRFCRSRFPEHGFFVLNRQGLEYVQEFLTSDSDVKIEGEFILYEPGEEAGPCVAKAGPDWAML